ncbi:unnamed protein product [Tenebrio molitor]|nr:unnamed protein product [Tenebrio molitor]
MLAVLLTFLRCAIVQKSCCKISISVKQLIVYQIIAFYEFCPHYWCNP